MPSLIQGSAGADLLAEASGRGDTLEGLGGDDIYIAEAGRYESRPETVIGGERFEAQYTNYNTSIREQPGGGYDIVNLTVSAIEEIDLFAIDFANVEEINITSSGFASFSFRGDDNANIIRGGALAETLIGNGGNDTISGGGGSDRLVGGLGNDRLDGRGGGTDTLIGGAGDDTYVIDAPAVITELAGEGFDVIETSIALTLGSVSIEKIVITGSASIGVGGNAANNTLVGNAGNNTLDGGGGADSMMGGAGDDVYFRDDTGDKVKELAGQGTDEVRSLVTYTLPANVEKLTLLGGTAALKGNGNADNNTLTGNAGPNILNGFAGADAMAGGLGNDTYYADNEGDTVTEAANAGTDRVVSTVSWVLGANIERLELSGGGNINGTGNALDNLVWAGPGVNILAGGDGIDTLSYAKGTTGAGVNASLAGGIATGSGAASDSISGFENLEGTAFADVLVGDGSANKLYGLAGGDSLDGGAGNDSLDGGAGNDTLTGGAGHDQFYVDSPLDVVIEGVGGGTDTIIASVDYTLGSSNVEQLRAGSGAVNLTGSAGNNTLLAGTGDNVLTGAGGSDVASYVYGVTGHGLVASLASGTASGGGTGNDLLLGFAHLRGSNFNDTVSGNDAANIVRGLRGNDQVDGAGGNDTLEGNEGVDTLDGGAGNDLLIGGAGTGEFLTGGPGADVFRFASTAEMTGAGQRDVILDFESRFGGVGLDLIDVSQIDADLTLAGDQAFAQGQVGYNATTAALTFDVIGDAFGAFEIAVAYNGSAVPNLAWEDLIL